MYTQTQHFLDQRESALDASGPSYVKGECTETETVGERNIWAQQNTYRILYSTNSHNSLDLDNYHTMKGGFSWAGQK